MANQQAAVTVTGFVAGDPTLGGTESFRVLTFRMGSTRSRLNPTTRQWEDYGTAWVGVKAFRALAVNAASSVRRGDRVVPELLRTLVFARPCGGDQFAAGTVSPSLDMSR